MSTVGSAPTGSMQARFLALLGCFALPACGQEHLTVNGCRCKQSWTEGEVHCDGFCCNPGGGVKWCQVEDPTCEDAGWGWCLEGLDSNAPAIPSNCRDRDDWHDLDGDGCSVYKANQWCTRDGKVGIGWHDNWGNIGEFAANGFTSFSACCACGGGDLGGVVPGADRSTYSNCKCKNGWDENGMSCEHACCNPDDDPVGEWCMVEDESCEASYWGYCRAGNVPSGEHPSGARHGRCADVPNFKDLDQEGCADYSSKAYCTEVGGYGLGWHVAWGTFDEFVQPGSQSAQTACCACGGGKRNDTGFEVGAQSFAASVPRWCGFLPERVRPTRCSPPPPEAVPAVSAPLPARCGQLAAEERANITACKYSEEEAIQFGAIAAAAFCQTEGWTCGNACTTVPDMRDAKQVDNDAYDAHAYVGRLGEACVLAFRGTDSLNGWAQDFASVVLRRFPRCSFEGRPCKVGIGFLQNYQSIARGIRRQLAVIGCTKSTPLFVTGHSLGAAMSALAIFDLNRRGYNIDKAYSFGQPRVGDRIFALAFNQAMAGKSVFRVTKADDPAVYVPPKGLFHHVGTEVYYKGDTSEGFKVCNGSGEDPDCQDSNGDGNVPALLLKCAVLSKCGHLQYLQPRIAFPMDASRCSRKLQSSTFLFP